MELLLILLAVSTVAVLAPRYGKDSRDLDRSERERDALWSRSGPLTH
jgi:hypothetical protein